MKMTMEKRFKFTDDAGTVELSVKIPEVLDPSYGMYTWPSAAVLAQMVWSRRAVIRGKVILELGAGTALPGIVAGLCGARIHLSDSAHFPQCLKNSLESCRANGLHGVPVHAITWGRFDPDLLLLPSFDIIIASDCFYDTKDFEDIIVTVSFILERNTKAEFWCAYQVRNSSRSIENLLLKWSLTSSSIPLETINADTPSIAGSDLPGNHSVQLFIIRRNDNTN